MKKCLAELSDKALDKTVQKETWSVPEEFVVFFSRRKHQ